MDRKDARHKDDGIHLMDSSKQKQFQAFLNIATYLHSLNELENIDFSFLDMSGQIFIPIQGVLTSPEKIAVHMRQLQDSIRSNYSFLSLNYLTTIIFCEIHRLFSFCFQALMGEYFLYKCWEILWKSLRQTILWKRSNRAYFPMVQRLMG